MGIWGSYYHIPKAIFYLLKGDYTIAKNPEKPYMQSPKPIIHALRHVGWRKMSHLHLNPQPFVGGGDYCSKVAALSAQIQCGV